MISSVLRGAAGAVAGGTVTYGAVTGGMGVRNSLPHSDSTIAKVAKVGSGVLYGSATSPLAVFFKLYDVTREQFPKS